MERPLSKSLIALLLLIPASAFILTLFTLRSNDSMTLACILSGTIILWNSYFLGKSSTMKHPSENLAGWFLLWMIVQGIITTLVIYGLFYLLLISIYGF